MIYGYTRVSTELQNTENQKHEIQTFANAQKKGLAEICLKLWGFYKIVLKKIARFGPCERENE